MDNIRQVGKILRKNTQESAQNIRRVAENFPQVERVVDTINPLQKFSKEFKTSGANHTVSLDFHVKEIISECFTTAVEEYASCNVTCPYAYVGGLGSQYNIEVVWSDHCDIFGCKGFKSNIGGFTYGSPGGIAVPISGIYSIRAVIDVGGVCVGGGCYSAASLKKNGSEILDSKIQYGPGYWFHELNAITYINAGERVGTFLSFDQIDFYTPYNLCWLGTDGMTITLIGLQ